MRDALRPEASIGPLLYLHGAGESRLELAALVVLADQRPAPVLAADGAQVTAQSLY